MIAEDVVNSTRADVSLRMMRPARWTATTVLPVAADSATQAGPLKLRSTTAR